MSSTSPVLTFAIRGTQALFAIVVFGLSTSLIKGHYLGSLPSTLGFVAFLGGLSFVGALVGIAAHWMQVLQGQVGVLMDAVIAGINIAGGILMAIKLSGVACDKIKNKYEDNDDYSKALKMVRNDIVCGGYVPSHKPDACYYVSIRALSTLLSRCKMSQADSAFMFLTAIVVAGVAVLGWMRLKRGY